MSGDTVTPSPVSGLHRNGGVGVRRGGGPLNSGLSASELNAFRISAVIDRLNIHLQNPNKADPVEFFNLCLSLSRGIDFAVANLEVPNRCREFPSLLKQVCQNKSDTRLQAAIMVLMISVKSACQHGWFSDGESKELSNLSKEIASNFGSAPEFDAEPSCSLSVISTIMSRFYPRMKMGHVFVFLEVKTGYDAYVSDFQISKNLKCAPGDKIRLFVVQTDSIETSSCLITPAKANFLLNGKAVDGRNNLLLDTGPQLPTVVTPILKYGSNLLQAVGEFNGNYIIAVALMSETKNPDSNTLQDYEQQAPANVDADTEVIEGASRVSLNCPISKRRIKTPVKGHSCKHIQCFDFDNYVDINSRTPFWRCSYCYQYTCFSDIRIDQKMVKVLKEVEPNVSNIIISSDGSWNAVMESEDAAEKSEDKTSNIGLDDSPQPANVLDLTQTDDTVDAIPTYETEDRKHSSSTQVITPPSNVSQSSGQAATDFWSGIFMSTYGLGSSNVQLSGQTSGVSVSSSILTASITPTNREVEVNHHNSVLPTSAPQNDMQLQQYQFGSSPISNDYGRFPSIPRNITIIPNAVQALPAQTSTSNFQRGSTNRQNSFSTNGLSSSLQMPQAVPNLTSSHADPHQVSTKFSSPLTLNSSILQNSPFPSVRPPHQTAGFPESNQISRNYGVTIRRGSASQQMANLRVPQATSPSPGINQSPMQSTSSFLRPQNVNGTGVANGQQSHPTTIANRAMQISVDTSRTVPQFPQNHDGRNISTPPGDQRGSTVTSPGNHNPADQSWRPPARMRGALVGQAYNDYYNQVITRPTLQAQAARPISNGTSSPSNIQAQFLAGAISRGNPTPPAGGPMGSDTLPRSSSGMQ